MKRILALSLLMIALSFTTVQSAVAGDGAEVLFKQPLEEAQQGNVGAQNRVAWM